MAATKNADSYKLRGRLEPSAQPASSGGGTSMISLGMRTSSKLLGAWCCRNKRGKYMIIIFLLALCFLVWQGRQVEHMRFEADMQDQLETFPRIINIQSHNHTHAIRQQNVIKQCQLKFGPSWSTAMAPLPLFKENPIISSKHKLLYCPVGKVASTFFTRIFIAIDKPGPMTSPFNIPVEQAGRDSLESLKSLGSKTKMFEFLQQSTKVVFGRNPFSRIFSAYIDKLFSPNPFYWTYWGERVLKLTKATKGGKPCASEVTFPQFIRMVLFNLHRRDVHLRQVYDECHMCDLVYDVIGTVETATEDIDYILGKVNISSSFQHEPSYTLASKVDIVNDSVQSAFSWKKDISRCISLDEMGLRIWRKLQIRGVLDSSIRYPFRFGQIDSLHSNEFIEACKRAILMSTDREKLKKQKKQAMVEAFKMVSYHDLVAIGNVYKDDFRMFGFNPKPSDIFEEQIKHTGSLNWRTDWIL